MSHLVGHAHPSIFKLIEKLQQEQARVQLLVLQDELGMQPHKRIRRVYVELQKRLHNLCVDYRDGRKTMEQFLRGVSLNIRVGNPDI